MDFKLVGTAGFEPATTTPPVWCATRLRYAPILESQSYTMAPLMQPHCQHKRVYESLNYAAERLRMWLHLFEKIFQLSNGLINQLPVRGQLLLGGFAFQTLPSTANCKSLLI